MGFPTGDTYVGTADQDAKLERQYLRKQEFMQSHSVPIWNGEFGPIYEDPRDEGAAEANQARYNLLGAQLRIYEKYQIGWSIWLYKDIGRQGMVYTSPDSKWNRTIQPFLDKKKKLRLDAWGMHPAPEAEAALQPLLDWIEANCPTAKDTYPTPWATDRHVLRRVHQSYLSAAFAAEFAGLFEGMGFEELEECAKSFAFEECCLRDGLNDILTSHAEKHAS